MEFKVTVKEGKKKQMQKEKKQKKEEDFFLINMTKFDFIHRLINKNNTFFNHSFNQVIDMHILFIHIHTKK